MRKNKPSRTAYKVALNIITLGSKPGMGEVFPACIVDATADLLVASGLVSATVVRWCRSRKMAAVYDSFEWMMPGQFEAFAHRKAFFERQVREGIDGGAVQVLNLGAGYDTTGWCLSGKFPEVEFFEIDHPATARVKAKGVESMGGRGNLHLIGADLTQRNLVDILAEHKAWKVGAHCVVQAEGLLMYLPAATVLELFRQCARVSGEGSRMVFTYVGTRDDGLPDAGPWTKFILWALKLNGEPWLWSIPPERLAGFIRETGWRAAPELLSSGMKHGVEFFGAAARKEYRPRL